MTSEDMLLAEDMLLEEVLPEEAISYQNQNKSQKQMNKCAPIARGAMFAFTLASFPNVISRRT